MYYSEDGISFDKDIKACKRSTEFPRVSSNSEMEEQTYAASQVLAYLRNLGSLTDQTVERFTTRAVANFNQLANERLLSTFPCSSKRTQQFNRTEILIAFDGSFTTDYTIDFLA